MTTTTQVLVVQYPFQVAVLRNPRGRRWIVPTVLRNVAWATELDGHPCRRLRMDTLTYGASLVVPLDQLGERPHPLDGTQVPPEGLDGLLRDLDATGLRWEIVATVEVDSE